MAQMHLAGFLIPSQVTHSHAMWRHPLNDSNFLHSEFYQNLAQVLERGKFNFAFFADVLTCYSIQILVYGHSRDIGRLAIASQPLEKSVY
jgi:alkanesulfonate monooxygenase SsuD/methylene tetrahydromethanopterin reductase-like flavin-dependent oxidoreductase (luciferase family)